MKTDTFKSNFGVQIQKCIISIFKNITWLKIKYFFFYLACCKYPDVVFDKFFVISVNSEDNFPKLSSFFQSLLGLSKCPIKCNTNSSGFQTKSPSNGKWLT